MIKKNLISFVNYREPARLNSKPKALMKNLLSILILSLVLISCKNNQETNTMPVEPNGGIGDGAPSLSAAFVEPISKAHYKDAFMQEEAIRFDIDLNFGGQDRLDGRVTMLTGGGKIRIDKTDGSYMVFDGKNVYMSPEDAKTDGARFAMFTWPYFFAFPYKLQDPGTIIEPLENLELSGQTREAFKLSFEAGTGDSPDDWYVGYLNPDHTIHAAGYIVTFGKTQEEAEKAPHAIVYTNYSKINKIPFAKNWTFYNWSKANGLQGEPLGTAVLSNIKFIDPDKDFFKKPDAAQLIE